ncbi:MAG: hypothetical protein ACREJB_06385 [Planctomycetaceae bacterium]
MTETSFEQLDELTTTAGPAAAIERLIETLRAERRHRELFDALLLRWKFERKLPTVRPTTFDDVPDDRRREFEEHYVNAAREVGELYLDDGRIAQAWPYLRTIQEPEKVAAAIERLDPVALADERTDELLQIALYEGANPVKGIEIMLRSHGTCNTITALDQHMVQMTPEQRRRAAGIMVEEIYHDLCHSVRADVQRRITLPSSEGAASELSLRELMTGRDWLFEEGNYHIDVSHLHSVVRFARFLDASPQLSKAIELAEYGSRLSPQFQYPGDPPFDEFYAAHLHFFRAIADEGRDEAIAYFRSRLESEPDEQDKPMLAYVLVDLLCRIDRKHEATDVAAAHLKGVDESSGFSLAGLCHDAGRLDTLRDAARERNDLVGYVAALVQDTR